MNRNTEHRGCQQMWMTKEKTTNDPPSLVQGGLGRAEHLPGRQVGQGGNYLAAIEGPLLLRMVLKYSQKGRN